VKGTLDFLNLGFDVNLEDNSVPTWVPSFTRPNGEQMVPAESHFCSSLDMRPRVAFLPKNKILSITKLSINTLQTLSSKYIRERAAFQIEQDQGGIARFTGVVRWLVECRQMANDLPNGNMSRERCEQFWRIMLWDNGIGPDRAPPEASSVFFTWFKGTCTLMLGDHDDNWWEQFQDATQA
jgi:hypothetical protein